MNGCIVSQYGDVEDTIKVPGMSIDPKIKIYLPPLEVQCLNAVGIHKCIKDCKTDQHCGN